MRLEERGDVTYQWYMFNCHFLMVFGDFLFNQSLMFLAVQDSWCPEHCGLNSEQAFLTFGQF